MQARTSRKSFSEIVEEYTTSEKLKLPVFPEVALELHKLLADPDVSIDMVVKVIETDQGLVAQLMKLANSGFYAGIKKTRTITDAILRLGLNNIFNYVVAIKQSAYYGASNPTLNAYLNVSFLHAICTAAGSQWLVRELGHSCLERDAYLSGLMHDIGKLLIIRVIDKLISEHPEIQLTNSFIHDAISSLHPKIGLTLLKAWNINEIYQRVVEDHHADDFDTSNFLLLVVRISDQSCVRDGVNTIYQRKSDVLSLREAHILNIGKNTLTQLNKVIEGVLLR